MKAVQHSNQMRDFDPSEIAAELSRVGVRCRLNEVLANLSYFKSGGSASLIAFPRSVSEMASCIKLLSRRQVAFKVIGETSNLLFLDDVNYTCLVSTAQVNGIQFDRGPTRLVCEAGALLPELSRAALRNSVKGFAGMEGIPGTVGGAVFMNASAYGDGIHKVLESVDVIDSDGSIRNIAASELELGYRNSLFKRGECSSVICRAYFRADRGNANAIYRKMELVHAKRHKYNEYMHPNLGSVFAGSLYRALAAKDTRYWVVSTAFYLLNYKFKIFRREAPINRKWLNDYTIKRFKIDFDHQPFSDKTMNTLINSGQHTSVHLRYIDVISKLTGGSLQLENEIVQPF